MDVTVRYTHLCSIVRLRHWTLKCSIVHRLAVPGLPGRRLLPPKLCLPLPLGDRPPALGKTLPLALFGSPMGLVLRPPPYASSCLLRVADSEWVVPQKAAVQVPALTMTQTQNQ